MVVIWNILKKDLKISCSKESDRVGIFLLMADFKNWGGFKNLMELLQDEPLHPTPSLDPSILQKLLVCVNQFSFHTCCMRQQGFHMLVTIANFFGDVLTEVF